MVTRKSEGHTRRTAYLLLLGVCASMSINNKETLAEILQYNCRWVSSPVVLSGAAFRARRATKTDVAM